MVDSSGSVNFENGQNWNRILNFMTSMATDFFNNQAYSVRIGVIVFSTVATEELSLTEGNNLNTVTTTIGNIDYVGLKTNTAGGIELAMQRLAAGRRSGAYELIFLIYDGESDVRVGEELQEADAAREAGTWILAIGVSDKVTQASVDALSSSTVTGYSRKIDRYAELEGIQAGVRDDIIAHIGEVGEGGSVTNPPTSGMYRLQHGTFCFFCSFCLVLFLLSYYCLTS